MSLEPSTHLEQSSCPMVSNRSVCSNIRDFIRTCEAKNGGYLVSISNCTYQSNKKSCWNRFKEGIDKNEAKR